MYIKKGKTVNKYLLSLMVLLPLTTSIYAQDAEDEEMEEVVTTGIKSSLKDAIDIKRKNVGIVDAITAEDPVSYTHLTLPTSVTV